MTPTPFFREGDHFRKKTGAFRLGGASASAWASWVSMAPWLSGLPHPFARAVEKRASADQHDRLGPSGPAGGESATTGCLESGRVGLCVAARKLTHFSPTGVVDAFGASAGFFPSKEGFGAVPLTVWLNFGSIKQRGSAKALSRVRN